MVDVHGRDVYLTPENVQRLRGIPTFFLHGGKNKTFLPETTEETLAYLRKVHPDTHYERHVVPNYGHADCVIGKEANKDVYPHVLAFLDKYN